MRFACLFVCALSFWFGVLRVVLCVVLCICVCVFVFSCLMCCFVFIVLRCVRLTFLVGVLLLCFDRILYVLYV